jgi:FkbM family methyltransferase
MNKIVRNFGRLIASNLLPKLAYPVLKGELKGKKIILGSMSGPGNGSSIYFDLVEKEQTREFIKHLNRCNNVFDIGANVGYYTLLASKMVGNKGKVYAFEPVIRNLVYLYKHIYINKIENVNIVPLACSDSVSLKSFKLAADAACGYLDEGDYNYEGDILKSIYVQTITLDNFITETKVVPDIIKIDVEGAELLVLRGAKDTLIKYKPKIFLSIHSDELEMQSKDYLGKLGYKFKLLDDSKKPFIEYLCV